MCFRFFALLICGVFPAALAAGPPASLHEVIDQLLLREHEGPVAPLTSDAQFYRRISLDLNGRIPTSQQLRQFLDDDNPDKRASLIDRLLQSPQYAVRMRDFLHVMLMERLGDHEEWLSFLEQSARDNKPWDQLVREILDPDADNEQIRGAAFFWTKRLEHYGQNPIDYPGLTRDVGRLFLGVDLQCAQCHDHLFIDDYKQADFQGLAAFTWHTFIRKDVKFPAVGEKVLEAPIEFASVFTGNQMQTGPRLPGLKEVSIPTFEKGEEFEIPPDRKKRFSGVPKFRPLKILAEQATSRENTAFARNSVNRFWFMMFGRGLVHPLDLTHSGNPPTHPELLDRLAKKFVSHHYDVKWLLKEIALTEAYQRSSRREGFEAARPDGSYAVAWERPLSAEQLLDSMLIATGQSELLPDATDTERSDELREKYKNSLQQFREAFANIPRDPEVDFRPSVKASLFLMNDPSTLNWFDPKQNHYLRELARLPDEELCLELYRSVLSREPEKSEQRFVTDLLAKQEIERERLAGHLLWGLVSSAEFALNH
jgi:hypothetical protein